MEREGEERKEAVSKAEFLSSKGERERERKGKEKKGQYEERTQHSRRRLNTKKLKDPSRKDSRLVFSP